MLNMIKPSKCREISKLHGTKSIHLNVLEINGKINVNI